MADEQKHTPGPWEIALSDKHQNSYDIVTLENAKDITEPEICSLYWVANSGEHYPHQDATANAHLIAAAPDLLEAAKELIQFPIPEDYYLKLREPLDKLMDAVKKAEGNT